MSTLLIILIVSLLVGAVIMSCWWIWVLKTNGYTGIKIQL